MTASAFDPSSIDAELQPWRQGDVILGSTLLFVHVADLTRPLSKEAKAAATGATHIGDTAPAPSVLESDVEGLIVLTQTCDIVRPAALRPYVELAPLVIVSTTDLAEVKALRRPALAYVPALADRCLVADLDRVMTIEKSVLVALSRQAGLTTDAEVRAFALALARKRVRFAFPDAFIDLVKPLQKRITNRSGKTSPEGHHVSALSEIRVAASPSWAADRVDLFFWFIKASEPPNPDWPKWQAEWLKLLSPTTAYPAIEGLVARLADMTAEDYATSEHLDLDHLSAGEEAAP